MKIVAIALGSRGDVQPMVALGQEMKRRGHDFTIITFDRFKEFVEEFYLGFAGVEGDPELMMKLLLTECKEAIAYYRGMIKLFYSHPNLISQVYEACKGSDLIINLYLSGIGHHIAEALEIPMIRVAYYPMDKTKDNNIFINARKGSIFNAIGYDIMDLTMNLLTIRLLNPRRKQHHLKRWSLLSSYKKINGKMIPTIYPYSEALIPKSKEWKEHIHVTGFFEIDEDIDYIPETRVEEFINTHQDIIYIGFGSIFSTHMLTLQERIIEAIRQTNTNAIILSGWTPWDKFDDPNICFIDSINHQWLFQRVKGIINHGGAGTTYASLKAGKPTCIFSFGGDQKFWGTIITQNQLGPKTLNIASKVPSVEQIKSILIELKGNKFDSNCIQLANDLSKEVGVEKAADIIEQTKL